MIGETNLDVLLKGLKPIQNEGTYVFCTISDLSVLGQYKPLMFFKEREAITVILKKEDADVLQIKYTYEAVWITLNIHSALNAVGLTAAFSTALANKGISCNVVAAFFHDHIFVNATEVEKAMKVLLQLTK
jgi:hypothetical protein